MVVVVMMSFSWKRVWMDNDDGTEDAGRRKSGEDLPTARFLGVEARILRGWIVDSQFVLFLGSRVEGRE